MIAHWPKGLRTEKGSITHQPGHLVDVMATLLDITGTEYPSSYKGRTLKPLRGKSLLPIFRGEKREGHEAIFFDWGGQHHAVRMGPWKLVKVNRGTWELYNLDDDRTELKNLASAEPERTEAMAKRWETWAKEAGVRKKRKKKK